MRSQVYTHILCSACGSWGELDDVNGLHCVKCGEPFPVRSEKEALIQEIEYVAHRYEKKRLQANSVRDALLWLLALLAVSTLLDPGMRLLFYVGVVLFLIVLFGLYTRPGYILDSHFQVISQYLNNSEVVLRETAYILNFNRRMSKYFDLNDQIALARRLKYYLDNHKNLRYRLR